MSYSSKEEVEEPAYLRNDPGLACLTAQMQRIDAQLEALAQFKKSVADAEKQCATATSSPDQDVKGDTAEQQEWVKYYDQEVQAEYWFNTVTGEASWLDPRYGNNNTSTN
jgi:hypothetical protein